MRRICRRSLGNWYNVAHVDGNWGKMESGAPIGVEMGLGQLCLCLGINDGHAHLSKLGKRAYKGAANGSACQLSRKSHWHLVPGIAITCLTSLRERERKCWGKSLRKKRYIWLIIQEGRGHDDDWLDGVCSFSEVTIERWKCVTDASNCVPA